jgi:hypothetical protein
MRYSPAGAVKVISLLVFAIPSTVPVTVKVPAASAISFTVAPPAEPVCELSVLSEPPVDDQATVLPETPEPLWVYFREMVTASVLSAVAEVLSADSVTPPQRIPA